MAKFKDVKSLIKAFKKTAKDLLDEKDFKDFAQIQVRHRKAGFDSGTGPDGSPWAKLKDSTIERKKRKKSPNPEQILVDTSKLRNTPPVTTTKDSATISVAKSRAEISKYHQNGTPNMVKREHWGFYKDAVIEIQKLFAKRAWKKFMEKFK